MKDVPWKWVCYIYATPYYPPNTSGRTAQCFWPLFLYHISLPVALSTLPPSLFPLPLYHALTFSNASDVSTLLVFLFFFLLNRLIMPLIFLPCLWTSFSFYSLIWSLLLPLAPLSTLYRFYPPKFVIFLSPLFVFLSHRPSRCQCCHHGRGAAAPSGSGGLPPRGVCQCLLPRLTGAAESGRELHAHPGLCALWHR